MNIPAPPWALCSAFVSCCANPDWVSDHDIEVAAATISMIAPVSTAVSRKLGIYVLPIELAINRDARQKPYTRCLRY